jgi:FtsH-binding integral membrane protein
MFLKSQARRIRVMKKMLQTILLVGFVILTTASFSYAQFSATGSNSFPYFHLGCLVVGGMIIVSLKQKYSKIYLSEAIGSFALYAVLIALFTVPVVDALKNLIN